MDRTDYQILGILQMNARATIKQISEEVNLSSPSVTERIKRMEEQGVILGYHARVNPLKVAKNLQVFIGVDVLPEKCNAFNHYCLSASEIIEHHRVIGAYSAILVAVLRNSEELTDMINDLKRYGTTNTLVVLSTLFQNKPVRYEEE